MTTIAVPTASADGLTLTETILRWAASRSRPLPTIRDPEDAYRAALVAARDSGELDVRGRLWRLLAGRVLCEYAEDVLMSTRLECCERGFCRAVRLLGGALMALRMLTVAFGSRACARGGFDADPCSVVPYATAIYRREKGTA